MHNGKAEEQERYRGSKEYVAWKLEAQRVLDDLVAQNFTRIYDAQDSDYYKVWGEISRELHSRFVGQGLEADDHSPRAEAIRAQRIHYLGMAVMIYSEEEFPHELMDDLTRRFVEQSGKLPKQLPSEWVRFEPEHRAKLAAQRRADLAALAEMGRAYAREHPEYAGR